MSVSAVELALAGGLLGAHVGRGADGRPGLGQLLAGSPSTRGRCRNRPRVPARRESRMFSGLMSR